MSTIPIPPADLLPRVGSAGPETFLEEGRVLLDFIESSLPPGVDWRQAKTLLDWGCGVGRLLFHLRERSDRLDLIGCDLDEASIAWLREASESSGSAFRVFVNREEPPLELDDASVDIVLGMSVFTHLCDWGPWLQELRRVLRPGAYACVSYQGEGPLESHGGDRHELREKGLVLQDVDNSWAAGGPNAFTSEDQVLRACDGILPVRALFVGGLGGYQSLAILQKPEADGTAAPAGAAGVSGPSEPRIGRPFVVQPKRERFVGHVDFEPFRDSWWPGSGWRGRASDPIYGWMVSRAAPLRSILARDLASGAPIELRKLRRADLGFSFPDVAWSIDGGFVIPALGLPSDRTTVEVIAHDEAGNEHWLQFDAERIGG